MGKSFVFRNEQGDPVGYLTQGIQTACCRIKAEENDEIIVFYRDGSHRCIRIEHIGREMEWSEKDCTIDGAAALMRGRVSAATSEDARRKAAEIEYRKKTCKTKAEKEHLRTDIDEPEDNGTEEQTKRVETAGGKAGADTQDTYACPQQRWPPPPCWKTAVYRHGAWDEEKA